MSIREILFRGKRKGTGEWVEGFLVMKANPLLGIMSSFILKQEFDTSCIDGRPTVLKSNMTWYEVDPKTVAQFVGRTDKKCKKIFEGDVVLLRRKNLTPELFYVIWKNKSARFLLVDRNGVQPYPVDMADMEVVGNIHDNPELLNGGCR